MNKTYITIDGNEAVAYVAYRCNEVMGIYPIPPSSNMGEWCDQWASEGVKNLWGTIPQVVEMQSEAGAAATVHGALQAGALTCTFTAAQGLLLKIPSMFKIAGVLTPTVFHIMVAVQPTRGLDVGAIEGVHRLLLTQREADAAVLLISEELEELLALSDGVYVIYEGRIMGEVKVDPVNPDQSQIEALGLMMTGTPLEQIHKEGVAANG